MTGVNYADDLALPTNTPAQTEPLLHSVYQAAKGIGLHVNAKKISCAFNKELSPL